MKTRSGTRVRAATTILIATAVAGLSTYILQAVVLRALGADEYLRFSVMWSVLYLIVGALAGLQQEVARASHPSGPGGDSGGGRLAWFALAGVVVVFVLVAATGALWGPVAVPSDTTPTVLMIAIGSAAYVGVSVLSGSMYGLQRWGVIATMIALDAGLRLVGVAVALVLAPTILAFAVAVVLPFPLSFVLVWLWVRGSVRGRISIDVAPRQLTWNAARTIVGAAATAVMVSGFPFLLGITSAGQTAAAAAVIAVVTLTRAPLVIPVMAMQSFLVVHFRDLGARAGRFLTLTVLAVLAVAGVGALLAALFGRAVLDFFDPGLPITSAAIAGIVFSAGLTAALCVSGSATLARNLHGIFTTGWVIAALTVIGGLLLPLDPAPKSIIALVLGPLLGLITHVVGLRTSRS
ncbi:hypothetical protein [Leifsonia sp. EB34]|uniref:hypothetical protein n=1 Tax=Leifsonia sp. EB34 TaxID=3156303 RepID=UPI0035134C43